MRRYAPEGALVLAALFYGVTFPLVHDALGDIEPFAFLLIRFTIAVALLAPFAIVMVRRSGDDERAVLVRAGLIAGVFLFGGYATQTIGLETTSPSTSAFITGLYAVFTPIIESALHRRLPPRRVLVGIALAVVGLYLLTGADVTLHAGELWTLACAVFFAAWIVYQGEYATRARPIPFTTFQMAVVAILCVPATTLQGVGTLTGVALFAAVFTGIACSSVALSLQVWAQRHVAASRAALILLFEPVFAALAGFVEGERLDAVELGGALDHPRRDPRRGVRPEPCRRGAGGRSRTAAVLSRTLPAHDFTIGLRHRRGRAIPRPRRVARRAALRGGRELGAVDDGAGAEARVRSAEPALRLARRVDRSHSSPHPRPRSRPEFSARRRVAHARGPVAGRDRLGHSRWGDCGTCSSGRSRVTRSTWRVMRPLRDGPGLRVVGLILDDDRSQLAEIVALDGRAGSSARHR